MITSMTQNNGRPSASATLAICLMAVVATAGIPRLSAHRPSAVLPRESLATIARSEPAPAPETVEPHRLGNFMDFTKALPFLTKSARAPVVEEASAKPVGGGDIGLYRQIFALQASGRMQEADTLIASLKDKRLIGHVLYQRYAHPSYKSSFDELRVWLSKYNDLPGANGIYRMAQNRMPPGYKGKLAKPDPGESFFVSQEALVVPGKIYKSDRMRSAGQQSRVQGLKNSIRSLVMDGQMKDALVKLQGNAPAFDNVEYDLLRAQIAAAYLYKGQTNTAYQLALSSFHRSGDRAPLGGWVAGLAAWKGHRYGEAAKFFEATGGSPYSSGWMAAAGSYWAARAHMRAGNIRDVSAWLSKAAAHPRTFYGLIATRALGHDYDFNWHVPTFNKARYDRLAAIPEGSRAMALVAAGQPHRAETELMRIDVRDAEVRDAILSYAGYADLPALSMRLGGMTSEDGKVYDAALYPRTPWTPDNGYKIDPSLINAIARQESHFDPAAVSSAGALGLMQIMPATASAVADDLKVSERTYRLKDPLTNLEIGQQYIMTLLGDNAIKGDMIKMLVAYNAGPGNLAKWEKRVGGMNDPLLFIETIPSAETRTYVERVLSNYWIYLLREGREAPTLNALAEGRPAIYVADLDSQGSFRIASR